MRRITLTLACALTLLAVAQTAAALLAQPFEGTRWKVTVMPDDEAQRAGEKPFDDVLVFKGGKFTAEACAKYGFKPVEYKEETTRGPVASFTAEPKSDKEGTAKWHGNISGSEMTGELTWTKPDGTVLNYTFKGERMAK